MKIGVYDSGLGGIWVLKSLIEKYPHHQYIYLGDQVNAPYGNKDKEALLEIIGSNFEWFKSKGVDHIVVACNTVCSIGGLDIDVDDVKVDGIIDKTVNKIDKDKYTNIVVFATPLTIEYKKYQNLLYNGNNNVYGIALPKLVSLIENNASNSEIETYLNSEFEKMAIKPDAVVLGCTHYPFVKDYIKEYFNVDVFDSNDLDFMFEKNSKQSTVEIYTSGDTLKFEKAIKDLFNLNYEVTKKC